MRDGEMLEREPKDLVAYTSVPFREWFRDLPYA